MKITFNAACDQLKLNQIILLCSENFYQATN
jgi:hypothetical protein